jgi:hypothetical protein
VAEGSERDADLPQFSENAPVAIGTAIWALLFVIGLVIRDDLEGSGREWWIWTAAAGVVLGLIGHLYMRRRQIKLLRRARQQVHAGAGSENT